MKERQIEELKKRASENQWNGHTIEQLDALLAEHPLPDKVWQAMHAWPRNGETPGTKTWPTHAVTEGHIEAITVLLYYGADPLQRCCAPWKTRLHTFKIARPIPRTFTLLRCC
jgi:hypothetical protein